VPVPAQGALIVVAALGLVFLSPIGGVLAHLWAADTAIREAALDEGARLAEVLAAKNAQALAESRPSAFDLGTVSEQRGVHGAVVADARGTVVAPAERLRHSIQSREAFSEAVKSHDVAAVAREDGLYDIVAPIRAEIAPGSGVKQVVGFSLVEYDAAGRGRERFSPWLRAMASTLVATVAAATLAVGAWWALARPLVQLRDETELALRGDLARVEPPARWGVLADLVHSINRVLARVGK
jgi:hypothetical protein